MHVEIMKKRKEILQQQLEYYAIDMEIDIYKNYIYLYYFSDIDVVKYCT